MSDFCIDEDKSEGDRIEKYNILKRFFDDEPHVFFFYHLLNYRNSKKLSFNFLIQIFLGLA